MSKKQQNGIMDNTSPFNCKVCNKPVELISSFGMEKLGFPDIEQTGVIMGNHILCDECLNPENIEIVLNTPCNCGGSHRQRITILENPRY